MFWTLFNLLKYDFNKINAIITESKKKYQKIVLLNETLIDKIIEETWKKIKASSKEEAFIIIAGLLQKGGANKNGINHINFTYNNLTLSAKELRNIVCKIKNDLTMWQLAWFLANDIVKIAFLLEMEGDLSNQIRYEYPLLSLKESIWCSSFQTTNPNCPKKIRNWLVKNYWNRFNW